MTAFPLWLYRAGYTDLISVIPPGAELAPGSRMQTSSLGKAPGWKLSSGKWAGYSWRNHNATEGDVEQWLKDSASFGLRADRFPGLDIDVMDEELAADIELLAEGLLGPAPVRYGRRPKRLLMYRTLPGADTEPISRMRLWLEKDGVSHLVELLGAGQQYLVSGTHPVTNAPYEWEAGPPFPEARALAIITRAQVERLFAAIEEEYGEEYHIYREGDGYARQNAPANQSALRAPSIDALQALVDKLPNDDKHYPGRDSYIRVGYAIRAASGDAVEEGFEVFASWAMRHTKDSRVSGNPATWREDYARMKPPFALGFQWLRDEAHRCGHNTAREDFEALGPTPAPEHNTLAQAQQNALVSAPGRLPNGDDAGHLYEDYLEHPEYAEMPPELIPRFAWRGLKTLFSGREKTGKSTLLLAGAVAATKGDDFLDAATEPQTVLWLSESVRPTIYYTKAMGGAAPGRLVIIPMGKEPSLQLAHAFKRWSPTVVVIDTLYRYASIEDENNASQWKPLLVQFDRVTENGAALVLISHALKAHDDGRYRGSSALGAWVDVIMEMANPQAESSVRYIACKGRVDVDAFSVRYDQNRFKLLTDEQKQAARDDKRERELLKWVEEASLRKHRYKAAELDALALRGLIVKAGGVWRVTTVDEQAQTRMQT